MSATRILIVEDEQIVALDIEMHLRKYGYSVVGMFASAEEALRELPNLTPDLVLMDIKLQGRMDGLEAASRIKDDFGIPVILLTANADENTVQRAKYTQPFAYIIKPFEERELRTAIVLSMYRHEMEQKLIRRERLFATTLRSIGEGLVVTNNDGEIEFINRVAEEYAGESESMLVGRRFESVFHLDPQLPAHTGDSGPEGFAEGALHRDDGSLLPVAVSRTPLRDERNAHTGYVWVLQDISARLRSERALRESEDQLRQAQKMEAVGRLSGGIAHDFNNLLTIIMGYAKLMKETLDADHSALSADLKNDLEGISKAAMKSASLTRQLLAFSRHQIMQPRSVSLNVIVSEVEKMIQRLITENVSMQVHLASQECNVFVDQGQLEQVIVNLSVNARDAMRDGGILQLRTRTVVLKEPKRVHSGLLPPGSYATLDVHDTGSGIPPEIIGRIFDPFFTTKESGQGTGLGLSTVYGIVTQSGGQIDVQSEPRKGATFTIYLPLQPSVIAAEPAPRVSDRRFRGSETVLIVEDEENIRALLVRSLRDNGYTVISATNAGEAMLISEQYGGEIDLLVTDVVMPHLSGVRLARRMKASRRSMRVLLISGAPDRLAREGGIRETRSPDPLHTRGGSATADHDEAAVESEIPVAENYLQKPFEPEEFLATVRSLLDLGESN